jgi:TusA-related sulfurtransferase
MTGVSNYFIDITNELCPLTFVKTKLAIERLPAGETIEVRLQGVEPLRNVPRSLREIGHEVLSIVPEAGEGEHGIHRLRVRKASLLK